MAQPLRAIEPTPDIDALITEHGRDLSERLQAHRLELFPPAAHKPLRAFQLSEAAKLLGLKPGYLRNLSLEGKGPSPMVTPSGRRSYTAEQIQELRSFLDENGRASRRYVPHRKGKEHLQIIAVVNFKGGSGKTTTATHLAQHFALNGYRVLAIDLDPQASLSALFGFQPEFDVGENETLYGAIRYDGARRPLAELIKPTNFPGLDIVPGNIELMEFEYDTPRILATRSSGQTSSVFFARLDEALTPVAERYDVVVIDCPPQLGYLTMSALCTATALLVTVHPQMLDVMSMCQFLLMLGDVLSHLKKATGGAMQYDWLRYLITRYESSDAPQTEMVAFIRSRFGRHVLTNPMLKSVAISDAELTKQTLYEIERKAFTPSTYDRAIESLDAVNGEIEQMVRRARQGLIMARKGILSKITGDQLTPVNLSGGPPFRASAPHSGFTGRGAFGAVSRSIDDLAAKAEAAREIEERLTAGETVLNLDPDKITSSFIADRLAIAEDDEDFKTLVEAIKTRGQDSPILVRPHPEHAGQFQIAFGHRRVRAAKVLGRQVRAVVKTLSDRDHLLAQGQENSARANLSFIERALYARRLEEHGFDREMIMSALTADKTLVSRMISITHQVPIEIIIAIGPAPSAGRPRWMELANAMQGHGAAENAERFIGTLKFKESRSDQRFEGLLSHLLTLGDGTPLKAGTEAKQSWSTPDGLKLVRASIAERSYVLAIDRKAAPDFGAFVLSQMDRLYADYSMQRKDAESNTSAT